MTEEIAKVKLKILYQDNQGSYTYSNLKDSATNAGILQTAGAFVRLQANDAERCLKIADYVLKDA